MNKCPYCQKPTNQVKAGHNPSGSQRFFCKGCGKIHTPAPKKRGYSIRVRQKAIQLYQEGQSFRAVARQLGIGTQSVINWVREYDQQQQSDNLVTSHLPHSQSRS